MTKREEFVEMLRVKKTNLESEKLRLVKEIWKIEDEIQRINEGLEKYRKAVAGV